MASLSKEVLKKYPNKYFVETGTYLGNSVQLALDSGFEKIITMEINPEKVKKVKERFSKEIKKNKVIILEGDTVEVFPKAMQMIDSPATFWLDAHWDDGPKGEYLCPLPIELDLIANHHIKNHTILIDDRRLFGVSGTTWGYTVDESKINKLIFNINSDYKISYENGNIPDDIIVASL